jgi:putative ABC transport system permease protein
MGYSENEEKAIQVYIMDEDEISDAFDLRDRKTKDKIQLDDGVVISEKYANLCNLKEGDDFIFESSNGIKQSVEITDICEMYTDHYLFISDKWYEKTFNETVYYDSIAVTSNNSAAVVKQYEDFNGVKTIRDFDETIQTFSSMLDTLDIIVIVIIIAAGALALVVIMNLTEVNISERIREIATLKVLGFKAREANNYINRESKILTLIGVITGVFFGNLLGGLVIKTCEVDTIMFDNEVVYVAYIYGVVLTLIFSSVINRIVKKDLQKIKMVESLKLME